MIKDFWEWFVLNQLSLRTILDGEYDLIDSILNELKKVKSGLAVEFEKCNEVIVMTISADGVVDNFEIVKMIVQSAPLIKNWKFIAFRQPIDRDKVYKISVTVKNIEIKPKDFYFIPVIEDEKLYVLMFSEKITNENQNDISYGCLLLLDNLIGEYDCVTKVDGYEFYNLSDSEYDDQLARPLIEIRDYIDNYYSL